MKLVKRRVAGLLMIVFTFLGCTSFAFAETNTKTPAATPVTLTADDLANDPLKWQEQYNSKGILGPLHNMAGEMGVEFYQFLFLVALMAGMCALIIAVLFLIFSSSSKGASFGKTFLGKVLIALFVLFAIPAIVSLIAAITSLLNKST